MSRIGNRIVLEYTIRSTLGDRYMFNKVFEYLEDESGQTSTEYILLVAVVALIVFKFKKTASAKLDALTSGVFDKANTKILQEMDDN